MWRAPNAFFDVSLHTQYEILEVEEILHKRIFSWDVHLESKFMSHKRIFSWDVHLESKSMSHKRIWDAHLESKYVSHKRIRLCEQSVYAESPLLFDINILQILLLTF